MAAGGSTYELLKKADRECLALLAPSGNHICEFILKIFTFASRHT
jgi:hypothetical protein